MRPYPETSKIREAGPPDASWMRTKVASVSKPLQEHSARVLSQTETVSAGLWTLVAGGPASARSHSNHYPTDPTDHPTPPGSTLLLQTIHGSIQGRHRTILGIPISPLTLTLSPKGERGPEFVPSHRWRKQPTTAPHR